MNAPGLSPAWYSPRERAIKTARTYENCGEEAMVDAILAILAEPDRDMLAAGLRQLSDRISHGGVCLETIEAIWRAMFDKARQ
jgi:hypothetical protein